MIIKQLKDRSKTLNDLVEQSGYFFSDEIKFDEKAKNKFLKEENAPIFEALINNLTDLQTFNHDNLHKVFEEIMNETNLKLGKIAQPARVALTGGTVSPGIFEVIEILGKETVLKRLKKALEIISKKDGD